MIKLNCEITSINKKTCHRQTAVYSILVLILLGCSSSPEDLYLAENDIFQYQVGDTICYKSNFDNIDTLIVDEYSLSYPSDSPGYQMQSVRMHFSHDQKLVEKYDSIFSLYYECLNNEYDALNRNYCIDKYDLSTPMSIDIENEAGSGSFNVFTWKNHPRFNLLSLFAKNILVMNGEEYNGVYIFERDEGHIDSAIRFQTIYFCYRFGILKYMNQDMEVFEFYKKL